MHSQSRKTFRSIVFHGQTTLADYNNNKRMQVPVRYCNW
jgi:hypothetical protein